MIVSAKMAKNLLDKIPDNAIIFLDVMNTTTFVHQQKRNIGIKEGKELIDLANAIDYEDNDFFGRMSLSDLDYNRELIHNLLFPQKEP